MGKRIMVGMALLGVALVLASCATVGGDSKKVSIVVYQVGYPVMHTLETAEGPASKPSVPFSLREGDVVSFGSYKGRNLKWLVLSVEEGTASLLSMNLIPCSVEDRMYNAAYGNVTWEDCSLKEWLCNELVHQMFGSTEISALVACEDEGLVSIPSAEEVERFVDPSLRVAFQEGEEPSAWWLRTQGSLEGKAAYVDGKGCLCMDGMAVNYTLGVRPTIVVRTNGFVWSED